MTDPPIRILRLVAHHAQRALDEHHSIDRTGHTASTPRLEHLELAAARTRARVVDADERRRNQTDQLESLTSLLPAIHWLPSSSATEESTVVVWADLLPGAAAPAPATVADDLTGRFVWATETPTTSSPL